jgi:subtilisin family serine protease
MTLPRLRPVLAFLALVGTSLATETVASATDAPMATETASDVVAPAGPTRVIVTLATDVPPESGLTAWKDIVDRRATIAADQNRLARTLTTTGSVTTRRYTLVPAIAATVTPDGLTALENDPNVLSIEPDTLVAVDLASSTGIVQADTMWTAGHTGAGTAIAVLDTGVQSSHPMFAAGPSGTRVVAEACFSSTDVAWGETSLCPDGTVASTVTGAGADCPVTVEGCGHGTHVAGIAAGGPVTVGATTIRGVAPEADIVAINVFTKFDVRGLSDTGTIDYYPCDDPNSPTCYDPCGGYYPCALSYTSDQLSALDHVAALTASHDIVAANMSLGGGAYDTACDNTTIGRTIRSLLSSGVTTVIAAGNSGLTGYVSSPGCVSAAVTVGATTDLDRVASYSNTAADLVDLYAPGSSITSSVPTSTYATYNGTSMAAPHVAGAFALMRDALPSATPAQILSMLQSTGTAVGTRENGTSLAFAIPRINIADASGTPLPPILTVTLDGDGMVTVASSPAGITCGTTCTVLVSTPTTYTLTAVAAEGSSIIGWTGCDSATGDTCTVAVGATSVNVTLTSAAVPPSNDDLTDATVITLDSSGRFADTTYTINASQEVGERTPSCASGIGPSIWYRWTAPSDGTLTLDLDGSLFDTVVAVWTGTTIGDLTEIGCNDDVEIGVQLHSRLSIDITLDVTYLIQVTGWEGESGHVEVAAEADLEPFISVDVATAGDGTGSITSPTSGITCDPSAGTCSGTLPAGRTVTLIATAASGSAFVAWSDGCAPRADASTVCDITPSSDITVTAWFRSTASAPVPSAATVRSLPELVSLTSDRTPTVGDTITVTVPDGTYDPHERVVITLHSDPVVLADVDASAGGSLSTTVTIPVSTTGGAHTLVALGQVSGAGVRIGIDVTGVFAPLTPARILDTRSGARLGALDGTGAALTLQVAGRGGVPVSGVSAVALNVTVVDGLANSFGGYVTVFPCGARPDASNLNFVSGQTVPNAVIAPLSASGTVCLYVYGTAHVLADVSGYVVAGFSPVTPARLLDTRSGVGAPARRVGALDGSAAAVTLQVTGRGEVPASGVAAVALNVTVVDGLANDFGGYVTVFPCGSRPDASNLNFVSGQTVPNAVIAPVSPSGTVCLYVYGTAHVLVDVSGYFTAGFSPLTPARVVDTRSGGARVGALDGSGVALEVQVTGAGGVPSSGVSAVALNVTVVDGSANAFGGYVTVYPCGARPDASNLNFISGQTVPNAVIAPVSAAGTVCLYVYGTAHLLVDVSGHL